MLDQASGHLDDRDFTPKTPEHLPEFQTDVAASHNDQVLGKKVDVHHGTVGKIFDLFQPRHLRGSRAPTHVNKHPFSRELLRAYGHLSRRLKAGVALVYRAVFHRLQPGLEPSPRLPRYLVLPSLHTLHVHAYTGGIHSEIGGTPGHVGGVGAGDHGLSRDTTCVDTGTAEQLALDDRN